VLEIYADCHVTFFGIFSLLLAVYMRATVLLSTKYIITYTQLCIFPSLQFVVSYALFTAFHLQLNYSDAVNDLESNILYALMHFETICLQTMSK